MLKIIGSAVIILSSTLFGMKKYLVYFERKKALSEILDGTRKINSKLAVLRAPLHELFMDGTAFFEAAASEILAGQLPEEAVRKTAFKTSALRREDLNIIERFASGLCAPSCEEQLSNFELFINELEKNLEEAAAELNLKGKLCVKGSILAAAALVLLLV